MITFRNFFTNTHFKLKTSFSNCLYKCTILVHHISGFKAEKVVLVVTQIFYESKKKVYQHQRDDHNMLSWW